ncbi:MAG: Aquaporin [Candidatus Saccharibacteria bacterium]|nr:Aquaporin [Candidatus Saccharibacteria bacterium]
MAATTGLHGSEIGKNMFRAAAAEFTGTFLLVLFGTGTAIAAGAQKTIAGSPADSLAVAFAFGLTLTGVVYAFGHTSGCHVNPAVTLGLVITGKFPAKYAPSYWISQMGGALCASLLVWELYGKKARTNGLLGATQPARGFSDAQILIAEAVITFALVLVILAVATDDRVRSVDPGIAIGLVLVACILFAGPISGGAANTARAFGPMIVAGSYDAWWAYLVGTLGGGVLGAIAYVTFFGKAEDPSEADA